MNYVCVCLFVGHPLFISACAGRQLRHVLHQRPNIAQNVNNGNFNSENVASNAVSCLRLITSQLHEKYSQVSDECATLRGRREYIKQHQFDMNEIWLIFFSTRNPFAFHLNIIISHSNVWWALHSKRTRTLCMRAVLIFSIRVPEWWRMEPHSFN